jgi:hypothetical protein
MMGGNDMKDLKRMAKDLLDLAYEVEDAADKEDNDRIGENLDMISDLVSTMDGIVEELTK